MFKIEARLKHYRRHQALISLFDINLSMVSECRIQKDNFFIVTKSLGEKAIFQGSLKDNTRYCMAQWLPLKPTQQVSEYINFRLIFVNIASKFPKKIGGRKQMIDEKKWSCWEISRCEGSKTCVARQEPDKPCWKIADKLANYRSSFKVCEDCLVYIIKAGNSILSDQQIHEIIQKRNSHVPASKCPMCLS